MSIWIRSDGQPSKPELYWLRDQIAVCRKYLVALGYEMDMDLVKAEAFVDAKAKKAAR